MTLKTKFVAGFCAVAVITLAVSVIGYRRADTLATAVYEIGAVRLSSIQSLDMIDTSMRTIQACERTLLMPELEDAQVIAQLQIEKLAWTRAKQGWAIYSPLPQAHLEAVQWKAFVPAWETWKKDHQELHVLIMRGRRTHDRALLDAARARSLTTTAGHFERASAILGGLLAMNDDAAEGAKERSVAGRDDLAATRRTMQVSALAGVAGAVCLGLFMARRLSNPVVEVSRALARIAQGDLTVVVPVRSGDEIGQMAVATNELVSALTESIAARHTFDEQLRQSQKLEAIGKLAGGVAHDFNNILTVILGKADTIAQDPATAPAARDAAQEIHQSGERAANLTRQLLAFSRRQAIHKRDVELNAVVANLSRMLQRIVGEDIAVQYAYGPAAFVNADPGMLEQVLMNLVVNARDAMPEGGRLTIETSAAELDELAAARCPRARAGRFTCLTVRDSGRGIAAGDLEHVFEPFFTTKDVGKGTGLGLATSYGIVEQHEGWIEVHSVVGRGTTFRVWLPRVDAPYHAQQATSAAIVPGGGHETLLVVEDEEPVRALICRTLAGRGYRVLEASSGPEATAIWHGDRPPVDLLITDMVMPDGMSGLDLARELRAKQHDLKVIYTSGYLADQSRDELLQREGATYLAKPFKLNELALAVRRALDAA